MQEKIIPGGLNNLEVLCHIHFMDEIELQAQEIYDRIIKRLQEAIKESPLTQQELSDKCGMEQPTISRIAGGKRGIDLPFKTVLKIALALNIDLTTLYLSQSQTQEKLKTILSEINKMIVND